MRRYAQALIALEARGNKSAGKGRPVAVEVCERLRPHFATLLGSYGVQAIIARSLRLASKEVPWLTAVRLLDTGGWELPEQLDTKITPEKLAEGGVVLVAHLLGLLMALMGEEVTLRQIHQIWSKRRLDHGETGHDPI